MHIRLMVCAFAALGLAGVQVANLAGADVSIGHAGSCEHIIASDVDGDGFDDIITVISGIGVALHRSLGDGRFEEGRTIIESLQVRHVLTLTRPDGSHDVAALLQDGKRSMIQVVSCTDPDDLKTVDIQSPQRIVTMCAVPSEDGRTEELWVLVSLLPDSPSLLGWQIAIDDGEIADRRPIHQAPIEGVNDSDETVQHLMKASSLMMFYTSSKSGDISGDGNRDVLVWGRTNSLQPLIFTGDGRYEIGERFKVHPRMSIGHVELADLDDDGLLDLVFTSRGGGRGVGVSFNGEEGFQEAMILAEDEFVSSVAVADSKGDGLLDLVLGLQTGTAPVMVIENLGQRQFADPIEVRSRQWDGVFGGPVAVGRFDANDHVDVVIGMSRSNHSRVFFNNGSGNFNSSPATPQDSEPPY